MQSSFALLGLFLLLLLSPCTRANYRCYAFGDGVALQEDGSMYTALCADDSYDLFYKRTGTRVERNMAVCESRKGSSKGWLTVAWPGESNYKVLTEDSETPAEFECRKAPTPCSFHPAEWLHFDEATKTLTCTNSDNTLRAIKHSSARFASLRCGRQGRSDVWKANAEYEWKETVGQYIADASPTLNVTCVEYCKPKGEGLVVRRYGNLIELSCADPTLDVSYHGLSQITRCSFEKGWIWGERTIPESSDFKCLKACDLQSTTGIHFDNSSKRYSCSNDDSHFLNLVTVRKRAFDSIYCHNVRGWRYSENKYVAEPYGPLNATCVKYCSWSGTGIVANRKSNELEVSCKDPGFGVTYRSSSPRRSLKCIADLENSWRCGWRDNFRGNGSIIDSENAHMELKCERYPHSCDLASFEGVEYDKASKKLICTGHEMSVIELNSEQYSSFQCDEAEGWVGKKLGENKLHWVDGSPLNFKCVEYCTVSGEGIKVERVPKDYYSEERVNVKCPDEGQLFYGDTRARGDKAVCKLSGWYDNAWTDIKITALNHRTAARFECRPAPTTTAKPTTTRKVWRPTQTEAPIANSEAQTLAIICASIGGIVLIVVVLIIIICVLKCQRRPDSGEIRTNIASERSEKRDWSYNDAARSARFEH